MEEDLQTLIDEVNAKLCGEKKPLALAYKVPYNELVPEIIELKFSEMIFNILTEVAVVYVTPSDGMVIWLIPKR